ncbi:MAG TPA: alpha/beta hydrolase [Verrucomicrobiae bacterium]|nr:alpha/beta hydrolase [Verrucomicrobiae bacterium]
MPKLLLFVFAFVFVIGVPPPSHAAVNAFAPGFTTHIVTIGGRRVYYRIGGHGSAVLLLHGYGDTGDMWLPLAPALAKTHTVIVPDLPGLGESRPQRPDAPYDMASVARTIHGVLADLDIHREAVVGHDIGLMVAYAYAAQYPNEVTRLALMDAPIPGVGPWEQILSTPALWHFNFYGKYAEELVAGRERIYLDRIWDAFALHPERITEAERERTAASYAQPGNMHAGFSYFQGFAADAKRNAAFAKTPLPMPVLAMGGANSFGTLMPKFASAVATHVTISVIPDAGHWLEDENPRATNAALLDFLNE